MKTRGLRSSDVESLLEMLVQNVEETVGETPHEKQDGDERYLARSANDSSLFKVDVQG